MDKSIYLNFWCESSSQSVKRGSDGNTEQRETALDAETAQSTADIIKEKQPKVVTIENVPQYRNSEAMKIITDMLDADGLSIGSEGMKGFYDKMLPSFVQKYTKKWVAKVGTVDVPDLEEGSQQMWSVDVTDSMKDDVMEGQVMFRAKRKSENTQRLNRYAVENIFGCIWIRTKQEYAKFASAVESYAFEEDGEGIAFTDNFLYAYYWNINGQPIPYVSVYLNREQSQDIVNQVNQEIKDGRKDKRAKEYFDIAVARYELLQSADNADNGNHSSASDRRGNVRLGNSLLRKGRYFDRPSLYVKTRRTDEVNRKGEGGC